jgi:hypothetical protein
MTRLLLGDADSDTDRDTVTDTDKDTDTVTDTDTDTAAEQAGCGMRAAEEGASSVTPFTCTEDDEDSTPVVKANLLSSLYWLLGSGLRTCSLALHTGAGYLLRWGWGWGEVAGVSSSSSGSGVVTMTVTVPFVHLEGVLGRVLPPCLTELLWRRVVVPCLVGVV